MSLTDEQLALLIDPKREHGNWWMERPWTKRDRSWAYTGPHLTSDRVAAFTHVTPVLLAAGWSVHEQPATPSVTTELFSGFEDRVIATFSGTYPAATTAAIAWMAEHDSERLRKAVEGVGPC